MTPSRRDTGPGTDYTDTERAALAAALLAAAADWTGEQPPAALDVRAQIEWSGHIQAGARGVRRTRLDIGPASLAPVLAASPDTVTDAFTAAALTRYGATIRLRDVEHLRYA